MFATILGPTMATNKLALGCLGVMCQGLKVGVVFRWVIFLAVDFWCTLPHLIVGVSGCFQLTMWDLRGLPLGEIQYVLVVLSTPN